MSQGFTKLILTIMLAMLIILPLITIPVHSIAISELNIVIIYDPTIDYGIVVYTLKLDTVLNDLSMIKVQLIGGTSINIVSVTNNQGEELLYKYDESTNEIDIIVNNTDLINITYEVKGLFQEIGIGAYISYIDLSPYSNINIKAEINLLGEYTIYSEPDNVDIEQDEALTIITLNTPSQYIIVAEETLPSNTTNTTPSSQTETTNETTYPSTSTIREQTQTTFIMTSTTTEASVEKTISGHSTTTSNKIETHKTTHVEGTSSNTTMWLSVIIVLLIIVAVVIVIKKK
ncbi:MAG: hypothetical protein J7J82_06375 [Staphylothermus sp.]|nr:hypothetical protein [Staphylothermus sp.]